MADKKKATKASSKPEKKLEKDISKNTKSEKKPEKKADKKSASEQSGVKKFFGRIKQFFKDVKGETKKIVWNSKEETIKGTGVVLMVTVIVGAGVWVSDVVFRQLMELIYRLAEQGPETGMIMLQSLTDLL